MNLRAYLSNINHNFVKMLRKYIENQCFQWRLQKTCQWRCWMEQVTWRGKFHHRWGVCLITKSSMESKAILHTCKRSSVETRTRLPSSVRHPDVSRFVRWKIGVAETWELLFHAFCSLQTEGQNTNSWFQPRLF